MLEFQNPGFNQNLAMKQGTWKNNCGANCLATVLKMQLQEGGKLHQNGQLLNTAPYQQLLAVFNQYYGLKDADSWNWNKLSQYLVSNPPAHNELVFAPIIRKFMESVLAQEQGYWETMHIRFQLYKSQKESNESTEEPDFNKIWQDISADDLPGSESDFKKQFLSAFTDNDKYLMFGEAEFALAAKYLNFATERYADDLASPVNHDAPVNPIDIVKVKSQGEHWEVQGYNGEIVKKHNEQLKEKGCVTLSEEYSKKADENSFIGVIKSELLDKFEYKNNDSSKYDKNLTNNNLAEYPAALITQLRQEQSNTTETELYDNLLSNPNDTIALLQQARASHLKSFYEQNISNIETLKDKTIADFFKRAVSKFDGSYSDAFLATIVAKGKNADSDSKNKPLSDKLNDKQYHSDLSKLHEEVFVALPAKAKAYIAKQTKDYELPYICKLSAGMHKEGGSNNFNAFKQAKEQLQTVTATVTKVMGKQPESSENPPIGFSPKIFKKLLEGNIKCTVDTLSAGVWQSVINSTKKYLAKAHKLNDPEKMIEHCYFKLPDDTDKDKVTSLIEQRVQQLQLAQSYTIKEDGKQDKLTLQREGGNTIEISHADNKQIAIDGHPAGSLEHQDLMLMLRQTYKACKKSGNYTVAIENSDDESVKQKAQAMKDIITEFNKLQDEGYKLQVIEKEPAPKLTP